jgi:hypothetical protein
MDAKEIFRGISLERIQNYVGMLFGGSCKTADAPEACNILSADTIPVRMRRSAAM